jgi:CPA1 family monovalent cation:H+ antiporter
MPPVVTVIGLLAAVIALAALARRIGVAYPVMLVVGGLALSFIPRLPSIALDPDVVFFVFLPPLLFSAGYSTSLRDFRANLRPIGVLAIGLVLTTACGVAAIAHAVIPGLSWPAAFVLGAIVSPTDPVAATAVMRRLGLSRRVLTVIEGESVVNDATGLAVSRVAVAAVVTGAFSAGAATLVFVAVIVVGGLVGAGVGWVAGRLLRFTDDEPTTIALTLLVPYVAYLSASALDTSGILAAAAAGLVFRHSVSRDATPRARVQARAVWDLLVFLLNGILFIVTGLELPQVWPSLPSSAHATALTLVGYGALISVVVIGIRILWVPLVAVLGRWIRGAGDHAFNWRETTVIGWAGMRGVLSLAAALALPVATRDGTPFPARGLILYLTFAVILATLVVQGGTLPLMLRRLRLDNRDDAEREEATARLAAAGAGLKQLEQLRGQISDALIDRLGESYRSRLSRLSEGSTIGECRPAESQSYGWLRRQALAAEREAVIGLGDTGAIGDDVLQTLEYELDVEALRLAAAYPIKTTERGGHPPTH